MFDAFRNRLTVEGFLVTESALRVGTGRFAAIYGTELSVIRDGHDRPFIPGSSFKGALRGYLEALVRGMGTEEGKWTSLACDPNSDDEATLCLSSAEVQRLKREYDGEDAKFSQAIMDSSCLVCQTFGSPWLTSRVRVEDLAVPEDEWFGQYEVRDGVAIDRDKGTVAGTQLYNYEVVPAGTRFRLRILADNLVDWQRGLLWQGLRALERGEVAIGGFTSRGLGWVKLQDWKAQLIEDAAEFIRFLAAKREAVGRSIESIEDPEAQSWVSKLREAAKERESHA